MTVDLAAWNSGRGIMKTMQHILVYADSLTWGIVPNTRRSAAV